ncbi:MAG: signal peptidase I [Gammaproteobacteria bacterium]|nr:signal peptidase I [Gammaproteobacteria bacterium]MBQ0839778.1 signal peptidase I [Gammaproteobacteria bacterium]
MDFDFPLILVVLTALAGFMWLADRLYLSKQREADDAPPWFIESTAPFFPVLLVVLVLRSFLVEPFQIPSGSMIPTLKIGDFILVNKFAYGLRLPVSGTKVVSLGEPERGDVMVFFPPNDKRYFIKRVVGLAGDEIRVINNVLFVNGEKMPQSAVAKAEPYFIEKSRVEDNSASNAQVMMEELSGVDHLIRKHKTAGRLGRDFSTVVPQGHYFMMGDNRDNSSDSRVWGPVPEENVVGKAFAVWMHWEKVLSIPSFDTVGTIR